MLLLSSWQAYVPWDIEVLYGAIGNIRAMVGTAFNVGIVIFGIIFGLNIVIRVVNMFSN